MKAQMANEDLKAHMQQEMQDGIAREWGNFQELLQQAKAEYEKNVAEVRNELDVTRHPVEKVIRIVQKMTPWEHLQLLEQTQVWTPLSDWANLSELVKQVEEKKLQIFQDSVTDDGGDAAAAAVVKAARGSCTTMSQAQYEAKKLILMKASHLKNDGAHASRKARYLAEEITQIKSQMAKVAATKPPGHGQEQWDQQFTRPLLVRLQQLQKDLEAAKTDSSEQYKRYDAMRPEVHRSATDLLAYAISDYHTNADLLRVQLEPVFSTMKDLCTGR